MKTIKSFSGKYRFLSNFYLSTITIKHLEFNCVEQVYQCAKTTNAFDYNKIYNEYSPGKQKKLGSKVEMEKNWEQVKVGVMFNAVLLKFMQNEKLRKQLIETDDAILIEGNTWGDVFWGKCDGKGKNWLGRILMIVRSLVANPYFENMTTSKLTTIKRRKK